MRDGTVIEGRIVAADQGGVDIDVAGDARRLDYEDLTRGRVQVEFRRLDDVDGDEG
jgi:ribosome maturation factor RimP